jgi:hypothetical protein
VPPALCYLLHCHVIQFQRQLLWCVQEVDQPLHFIARYIQPPCSVCIAHAELCVVCVIRAGEVMCIQCAYALGRCLLYLSSLTHRTV